MILYTSVSQLEATYYTRAADGKEVAIYTQTDFNNPPNVAERYVYGLDRIGYVPGPNILNGSGAVDEMHDMKYELKDHLGNVRVVFDEAASSSPPEAVSAFNYYSFGSLQPNRGWALSDYRRGFNGQEREDHIMGDGKLNTAKYWFYNPHYGLRWNMDPKPRFGINPYEVFGNNPISNLDINGDKFDETGQKNVNKFREGTHRRIASNSKRISTLNDKISNYKGDNPNKIMRWKEEIAVLEGENKEYNVALEEIVTMEQSDQMYSLRIKPSSTGNETTLYSRNQGKTYYDKATNTVIMSAWDNDGSQAHELLHGFQYEIGKTSFSMDNPSDGGYIHDATDELEGFKREGLYRNSSALKSFSVKDVVALPEYNNLSIHSLDKNTPIGNIFSEKDINNLNLNKSMLFKDFNNVANKKGKGDYLK